MAGARRRILVIEDDAETAEQIADFLKARGYQVDLAANGNDGLELGRSGAYAVLTIDRMLPGMDGIAIIRRLREAGIVTPALIVSALGEVDDRVRGLRAGGDDYLVKPFAFSELLARIEALARRSAAVVKETVLRVGDLELDLVSRTANRGGKEIKLLPREFQVLEFLVRKKATSCRAPCCWKRSGICISIPIPTSSTSMSDACAARSTLTRPIRSFTPCGEWVSVSGLLAKTIRSTTFRLALISIAVFGAVVLALFGYVYWSTTTFALSRLDAAIAADTARLRDADELGGRDGLIQAIAQRLAAAPGAGGVYLLADASFKPLAGNLKQWPVSAEETPGWVEFRADALQATAPGEQSLYRARWHTLPDGSHLLVGRDIDDLNRFIWQIRAALAFAVALLFVLAAVASVSVTRRTVGRIEAINATSRAIMDSGLNKRIPLRGSADEWDQLAQNLNSMLERIEGLVGEVKEVSDNVAHDLRTPLTRMRGRLEKAGAAPRDPERDRALIGATIADLDDVLRIFSSLTRISQIETVDPTAAFRPVDLVELATEVAELFDAAAEDRGGRVEVVGADPVFVTADRDLLFDAMANLVDNAIKHGRDGGRVVVSVEQNGEGASLVVTDDGPGIPADEFHHVFRRFYRLERSRRTPGNGLGLSLVAAIARLHGARVALSDNAPGLRAELHFPLAGKADTRSTALGQ
jgi:DNA-binding response OmpR family regulator/signal transduction histidine kinase